VECSLVLVSPFLGGGVLTLAMLVSTHQRILHKTHRHLQVEVFWVVTLYCIAVRYQHFGGSCCLQLQGDMTGAREKEHIYRPGVQEGKWGFQ
jgi:hypothetical protein